VPARNLRTERGPIALVAALAAAFAWPCAAQTLLFADGFEAGDTSAWGDLTDLSDDFEDGTLLGWQQLNAIDADVSESGGELRIAPHDFTLWYNGSTSILVWKQVTGDFRVTARVRARKVSNGAEPPSQTVELGGLLARDGGSVSENYLFVVVGDDVNDLSLEAKTTDDGVSLFEGPSWAGGEAELRICRLGTLFHLYARPLAGGAWLQPWSAPFDSIDRPDLPATLQVGANAYDNNSGADLDVRFESIDFFRPQSLADCTN